MPDSDRRLRVLVLAPTLRDADVTRDLLARAGMASVTCRDIAELAGAAAEGAGAAVLTEEVIDAAGVERLLQVLGRAPAWSELPLVILARGRVNSGSASGLLRNLHNVTLLERPAPMRSVVSAVQAALRGRERQYQIGRQIDELRSADAVLRASEERYRRLVEQSPDAVFVNANGVVAYLNAAMVKLFGAPSADALLGRPTLGLVHPDDRAAAHACVDVGAAAETRTSGGPRAGPAEQRWVRLDGSIVEVECAAVAVPWESGTAMQVILRDVSDRLRAERELRRSRDDAAAARDAAENANRLKDEFLATLSHELRTPLNAIIGWATILRGPGVEAEDLSEGLETIERNAKVQTQLIEDLLDVSRITSGKLRLDVRPLDLSAVTEAALASAFPAAEAKGVRLQRVLDGGGAIVRGDPGRLQQVVWNLLSNAIKFTPRGGRVTVTVARAESRAELSVSDTGAGMPPEFLPHAFERFRQADGATTRQHGGLGLGLAIVRHLVELQGGTVSARSPGLGRGSTFRVALPIAAATDVSHPGRADVPARPGAEPDPTGAAAGMRAGMAGIRALVVDDEADSRNLLRRVLEQEGLHVSAVASAAEAMGRLRGETFDLLMSDIGMPDQDGYELIRQVRQLPADHGGKIPAIAVTAFARPEDHRRTLLAGFQHHLSKPLDPAELPAIIARVLSRTLPAVRQAPAGI